MEETINEFLKFRSQFTKREWFEINQVVEACLNEKADQLKLDDSDVEIISKRLEKLSRNDLNKHWMDTIVSATIVNVDIILMVHRVCFRFRNW